MTHVIRELGRELGSHRIAQLFEHIDSGSIGSVGLAKTPKQLRVNPAKLVSSLYRGEPVGPLILWEYPRRAVRLARVENTQPRPDLLVVGGWQRLSSLYGTLVGRSTPIIGIQEQRIQVAFNPVDEQFIVAGTRAHQDRSFIPDIAEIYGHEDYFPNVVDRYLENLPASIRRQSGIEGRIEWACSRIYELADLQLFAVKLDASSDMEHVVEVLTGVACWNSSAKQYSFVSQLSNFWKEGLTRFREFCKGTDTGCSKDELLVCSESSFPPGWPEELCYRHSILSQLPGTSHPIRWREKGHGVIGESSALNELIIPSPNQLLRATINLGFRCATFRSMSSVIYRLQMTEIYSTILEEAKDLEILNQAQKTVLNLKNWHTFIDAISASGYIGGRLISSEMNLIFTYVLFLIGKTKFNLPDYHLISVIARWFFMSSLTRRYSRNPEAVMASDLAKLQESKNRDEFVSILAGDCDSELRLTDDGYWSETLPDMLEVSSVASSLQFAYWASLVLLDANSLGSQSSVSHLLNPSIHATDVPIAACDWFFSKEHIESLEGANSHSTNRIGNFVLTEHSLRTLGEGCEVDSGLGMASIISAERFQSVRHWHDRRTRRWHAIPNGWQGMKYGDFLRERCKLIAAVIREAYLKLERAASNGRRGPQELISAEHLLHNQDKFDDIEFKPTLRRNEWTRREEQEVELSSLRIIVSFLNSHGGTLILGASKDGGPEFCEATIFETRDNMWLHLMSLLYDHIGKLPSSTDSSHMPFYMEGPRHDWGDSGGAAIDCIYPRFEKVGGAWVLRLDCLQSSVPLYLWDGSKGRFFVRRDSSTEELTDGGARKYIEERFPDWRP